ncbi:UNVERIFIED_CONTAM: hypothetical protein RMT77_010794 [Armadillidium vulgare]
MGMTLNGVRPIPKFIFPLVLGAFTAVTYVGFVAVYTVQPQPFIDEIFHIPQAQKYCQGNFIDWDPKITTLPGLYLFSIGLLGPVSWITGRSFCDVICLRLTNLVGVAFTLSTIHKLLNYLHGERVDGWKLILASFNLGIFPVFYWFSFLYYTDVLSTLLVLIMMLLHIHKAPNFAAVMGIVAVFMRQTNIVWVGFLAGLLAVDAFGFHTLRAPIQTYVDVKKLLKRLRKLSTKPLQFSECLANIIADCCIYALVILSFCVFVILNGGIVVGDRDAHKPTLHLMQIFYFCLFFLLFSPFYAVEKLKPFISLCKKYPHIFLGLCLVCALVVQSNTIVHPFLLADNRHYTFYVWNKFYGKWIAFRYLVIPLYIFGAYVIMSFIRHNSFAFKALYIAASIACLVPQRLLEPRYFILPFLVARLQMMSFSWKILTLEACYYVIINAITMYIFLMKTFKWEDLEEQQRIIW